MRGHSIGTDTIDIARLSGWLQAQGMYSGGPISLTRFPGGQSNPTYRLDTATEAYVLRRRPFGPLAAAAHAIDREYRVISALQHVDFPAPGPTALCLDESIIGSAFYIMDLVQGDQFEEGSLPGMTPVQRTQIYYALIDSLAALHSIDHVAANLADYGRPAGYMARQVSRWSTRYRDAQTDDYPEMERLIEWLPRTVPPAERPCIVHGDYRIDNVIFAAKEPRVLAVLDWELSTIGDPVADLAYLLVNWIPGREARSSVAGLDLAALGIPTLTALCERYCTRTGRSHLPDLKWYFSFNLFRLACIVQGIRQRVHNGNASNANAADTATRVPQLARCAWASARDAGAE